MALVGLSDSPANGWVNPSDIYEVCHRVNELVNLNTQAKTAQRKIRDLMDGGVAGLRALVGQGAQRDMEVLDQLPAGNPILSGITHLSTKLQQVPDLRIVPEKDTDQAKRHADIREHILRHQDEAQALEAQMPQVGMWLPGYGFAAWVGRERVSPDGLKYLHFELRDPMECYPGDWGVDQQPEDVAFVRHIPLKNLLRMYPDKARDLLRNHNQGDSQPFLDMNTSAWSNTSAGIRVAEYVDWRGTWYVIPEKKMLLEHIPNPCTSGPLFVLPKRFAFNKLQGHYDHVIGLMAMHARLTVLQAQWTQDNVHTETNIIGQAPAVYNKGRHAINEFDPGTQIVKPVNSMPFQAFQAIDRLERQLRTTARYSVTDDAQSPTSWATGAGLEELGASMTLEVRTYQTVLRRAIERQDALRLEWEDRTYGTAKRSLVGEYRGQRYAHTYEPSTAIGGHYRTRRKYGFMAGWDESRKLVGGLQLTAAKIIPRAVMRENLDGLDESLPRVEALIDAEMAEDVLRDTLLQMAQNGDPRAITAVIRMIPAGETRTILEDVFMPEEAEEVPPEQAPLPEAPPGLEELLGGDPQILARMSQSGSPNAGGVQVQMGGGQ